LENTIKLASMNFTPPQNGPIRETPPYSELAKVYDRMMAHVNYRQWADYVIAILKKEYLWPGRELLDIGCGTGRFLEEAERRGQLGDGCDPSPHMLKVARERLGRSQFYQSALPELPGVPAGAYQVFTCLYDTMNYLLDTASVARALIRIFENLRTPGLFIFDLVSEVNCRHYFHNYRDSDVLSETCAYYRESRYDVAEKMQFNWIRVYSEEGIFQEEHRQRIYDFDEIEAIILEHTHFEIRNIYGEFSFRRATPRSGRAHFVLKKS